VSYNRLLLGQRKKVRRPTNAVVSENMTLDGVIDATGRLPW
jgi:hypothetical protein